MLNPKKIIEIYKDLYGSINDGSFDVKNIQDFSLDIKREEM